MFTKYVLHIAWLKPARSSRHHLARELQQCSSGLIELVARDGDGIFIELMVRRYKREA